MKIIAVTNIKGGVGKTTTAVNLAFLCAAGGRSTLLWDLDPQGAATYILRCEPNEHASAKKLVAGKRELPELLVPSGHANLDVLPSDLSYRNFDVHLSARKHPTERLLKMSRPLRDAYAALLPFFSMVDRRKSLHHEVIASTRESFPELLATEVPYSSEIERMSLRRAPIPTYSPRSAVGQIYSALWQEIETRMAQPAVFKVRNIAAVPQENAL
jgi:chromosome partitioning protein